VDSSLPSSLESKGALAPFLLLLSPNAVEVHVEDSKIVEKKTEVERETVSRERTDPKTTNVNVGRDGSTQVQEEQDIVDDPVGSTIIRQEETVEKQQR
jgi:hypothetical protein